VNLDNVVAGVLVLAIVYAVVVLGLIVSGRGGLAREVAMLLPHLLQLFRGLMADARVPRRAKVALAIAAVWLASPIDLIPEFIPIAGPLDDAIVAALVLRYVLRSTDRSVIQEHWHGEPRMLARLLALTGTHTVVT
jgi:uncharacterized membrane protein YkvA (DUF1232 family)